MKLLIIDCCNGKITPPKAQKKLPGGGLQQSEFGFLAQTLIPLGWKVIFLTTIDKLNDVIRYYGHLFLRTRGAGAVYSWVPQEHFIFNGHQLFEPDNYYMTNISNNGFGMTPQLSFLRLPKAPPTCHFFCGGDEALDMRAFVKIASFYPECRQTEMLCLDKLTLEHLMALTKAAPPQSPPRPATKKRLHYPLLSPIRETDFTQPNSPPPLYGSINHAEDSLDEKDNTPIPCGCCPPIDSCSIM